MTPLILLAAVSPTAEVFFDFDSARAPEGTSAELRAIVDYAHEHPTSKIVIDGNTDSVGSFAYNVGLSLRRAKTIRSQLQLMGVTADQVVIVGYGENNIRRANAAYDRRVTVWTTDDPLYAVIDHSLTRATAVLWDKPVEATALVAPRPIQTAFR